MKKQNHFTKIFIIKVIFILQMPLQNIKNNFTRGIECRLINDKYYDYMLYKGETYAADPSACLSADFSTLDIDEETGKLYSTSTWSGAVADETVLEDIGFTGPDNGFILFRKDRISNDEFLRILTESTYKIESGDTRLFLSPVSGNTQLFSYPMYLVDDETGKYLSFQGGFYQGFFKLFGFDYQTLPTKVDTDLFLEFRIRPRTDYETDGTTVNDLHPENKGIFFFMGTRAENKFWNLYGYDEEVMDSLKKKNAVSDGYFSCSGKTYDINRNNVINSEYLQDEEDTGNDNEEFRPANKCNGMNSGFRFITVHDLYSYKYEENSFCRCIKKKDDCDVNCDEYFIDEYMIVEKCAEGNKAIDIEYLKNDAKIEDAAIYDSFGHSLVKNGYYQIVSDNKFLMFDRTKEGFTVKNWIEGTTVTLTGRTGLDTENYFLLMNRTKTGMTARDIIEERENTNIKYDIYRDIRDNAFALKIKDDGSIGYRYGATDCDSEEEHYSIHEEYSKPGIIKPNEWNTVFVRFMMLYGPARKCSKNRRKMKIMIYVNGFLVFISKELKELNFRELNDVFQKQEGVPYNISLGGGTQGLLESILPDYYNSPNYTLPLERDFCGTFMGDIESFRIYTCFLDYQTIKNMSKK